MVGRVGECEREREREREGGVYVIFDVLVVTE